MCLPVFKPSPKSKSKSGSRPSFLKSFKKSSEKETVCNDWFECALYATQGRRKTMEDKHVISLSLPNHPSYALFGVMDGFNGDDASTYFSTHIAHALDALSDLDDNDAITKAVGEMDANYIHPTPSDQRNPNAGCTFVFAVVTHAYLGDMSMTNLTLASSIAPYSNSMSSMYSNGTLSSFSLKSGYDQVASLSAAEKAFRVRVFWAGDARAVLMSDSGPFERLTSDHHCSVPKEAKRIANAKGTIINGRVNGICEVTRCFGCRTMKSDASLPSDQQKMVSVPEQTTVICRNNDRLLIFCDGLVKKWSDKQFNTRCKHHVTQHKDEKNGEVNALKYLCEQAMDEGSKDNITVLSVKFKCT